MIIFIIYVNYEKFLRPNTNVKYKKFSILTILINRYILFPLISTIIINAF